MNPPIVYEETKPSTHSMIRIIAIVSSIFVSPKNAVGDGNICQIPNSPMAANENDEGFIPKLMIEAATETGIKASRSEPLGVRSESRMHSAATIPLR